ncbi:uncharacterized protein CEXT_308811 [Caerostris extrusa]|uniref:Uncharacterized protein n=1 Tax=Caerostris extrusa TaxID=172846 RepID=A0AAV4TVI3_CAEEX|nr:uncharacterized protein CEXT_308811 [Caerostris extrusa]
MQFLQGRLIPVFTMIITVCVCRVMPDFLPVEECVLPECKCSYFYSETAELTCQNISDFEAFDHILSNGSVFDVNTTFYIFLSGNTVLPKGFLNGLGRAINDSEDYVKTNLEQMQNKKSYFCLLMMGTFLSSEAEPRERRFRLRCHPQLLLSLHLDNSRLTQLRGDNLKNMTRLQKLSFVNNSIAHVTDDVFQGAEKVFDFDISHNLLTNLPPTLFKSWKDLEDVRLSYNQLLHVDHLFVGKNPKVGYIFMSLLWKANKNGFIFVIEIIESILYFSYKSSSGFM